MEKVLMAAVLTIKRPGNMTARGRKQVAVWLRQQAAQLVKHGDGYTDTGNYQARWRYVSKVPA